MQDTKSAGGIRLEQCELQKRDIGKVGAERLSQIGTTRHKHHFQAPALLGAQRT